MEVGEVFRLEAEGAADFDGQHIAEREHDGGGSCGRQLHCAGLAGHADVECEDAGLGERGRRTAAEADECRTDAFGGGEKLEDFFGFAAVREREQDVSAGEDADVAVQRFSGVQELRGDSDRNHRGDDLAGDQAALAHTGENDAVVALRGVDHDGAGLGEGVVQRAVESLGKGFERGGFDADEVGGGFGLGLCAHVGQA